MTQDRDISRWFSPDRQRRGDLKLLCQPQLEPLLDNWKQKAHCWANPELIAEAFLTEITERPGPGIRILVYAYQ